LIRSVDTPGPVVVKSATPSVGTPAPVVLHNWTRSVNNETVERELSRVSTPSLSSTSPHVESRVTATPHPTSQLTPTPAGVVSKGLNVSEAIANVIIGSGTASGLASAVVTVTAANKASTTARLVQTAVCVYDSDKEQALLQPPWYQYVLPVPIPGVAVHSSFRAAVGALVWTTALLAASFVATVVGARKLAVDYRSVVTNQPAGATRSGIGWPGHAGTWFALMLTFYGPNVVELAMTAAAHGDVGVVRAIAVLAGIGTLGALAVASWLVVTTPPHVASSIARGDSHAPANIPSEAQRSAGSDMKASLRRVHRRLFDGARQFD
jgi:hypothetical protein